MTFTAIALAALLSVPQSADGAGGHRDGPADRERE
jgi:hypothetical protein